MAHQKLVSTLIAAAALMLMTAPVVVLAQDAPPTINFQFGSSNTDAPPTLGQAKTPTADPPPTITSPNFGAQTPAQNQTPDTQQPVDNPPPEQVTQSPNTPYVEPQPTINVPSAPIEPLTSQNTQPNPAFPSPKKLPTTGPEMAYFLALSPMISALLLRRKKK